MKRPLRFGILTQTQYASWEELRQTWRLLDDLGYDTAWTFDHFFPIFDDPSGPCLEGWVTLTALMMETSRLRAGVLVSGNTYRHPAVLAKMAATLDHISGGRLILGLGAAWYEREHVAYGIPFYTTSERIRRLGEAAYLIKRLWTEPSVTFEGQFYRLREAYCEPKPIQRPHPPIMIGGGGEKLTLRVVAEHADQWNTFGSPEDFRRKIAILREHGRAVGRDTREIEVSWAGVLHVTDSASEKAAVLHALAKAYGQPAEAIEPTVLVGSVEEIGERLRHYIEVGVTHFIGVLRAPFHHASLRRFAEAIIPIVRAESERDAP
ncbi:MAG: LLM class F420-dependent oxidoreductase [Blastocatellia bacterium]|nr:LLM class F420-dependent oxidoreductase [Blastocatellia bacterium]MCS7158252.1 LLM class F420-dependent oxidoreductase [Blastocatellia bacterium]MCX7753090.1 LLM class F420-dependent oxidoreductase [Blastocatellia bacterium]MDW8169405.1 LLM class F420-dependent oxidoreductase [Acidobacteriota bacterium]MDW8256473.1 LLM class F420-dependent oxidoreductase [Acidobacteriota bacterium]